MTVGVCVALDKALPLFYGIVRPEIFAWHSFFFCTNMDKGCNSIVTEGQGTAHQRLFYLLVDRGLFLMFDNSHSPSRHRVHTADNKGRKRAESFFFAGQWRRFTCIFTLNVLFALWSALTKSYICSALWSEQQWSIFEWIHASLLHLLYGN